MVYLIYDKNNKLTKIGKSNNPTLRFGILRISNPNIVLVYYGDVYSENQLHEKYKHLRISGEWFSLSVIEFEEIIGTRKGLPKSLYYRNFTEKIKHTKKPIVVVQEIKLKYYNSVLRIGFNNYRKVYDVENKTWLEAKEHKGRIVYGNERIPYSRIKKGIDQYDLIVQQYCPF